MRGWFFLFTVLSCEVLFASLDPLAIYRYLPCCPFKEILVKKDGTEEARCKSVDITEDRNGQIVMRDLENGQTRSKSSIVRVGEFPGYSDSLGDYINLVDSLNRKSVRVGPQDRNQAGLTPGPLTCGRTNSDEQLFHPALKSLAEVSKRTRDMIVQEIKAQRDILEVGIKCFHTLNRALLRAKNAGQKEFELSKPAEGSSLKDYSPKLFSTLQGGTPTPEQCADFTSGFENEISHRFDKMRKYMALMAGQKGKEPTPHISLKHNTPVAENLMGLFMPSLKTRVGEVRGLSQSEFSELPEFSRSLPHPADKMYELLISGNPILLQIDQSVTPSSIQTALQRLKEQASFDLEEFKKDPQQEMLLHTPYVLTAISEMPEPEQQNACHAVTLVHRNLVRKYKTTDQVSWQMAVGAAMMPYRFVGAQAIRGAVEMGKVFASRAAVRSPFVHLFNQKEEVGFFMNNERLCSEVVMQPNEVPRADDICRLYKNREGLGKIENEAAMSTMLGFGLLGSGRLLYHYRR